MGVKMSNEHCSPKAFKKIMAGLCRAEEMHVEMLEALKQLHAIGRSVNSKGLPLDRAFSVALAKAYDVIAKIEEEET
jgi:hypothetical protein